MAEALNEAPDAQPFAEPELHRRRGISPIWAVPIVAALVAAWLGYTAFAEKGPTISISFQTAAGIEPGKTRIKYHDIDLGVVNRIDPSPDLSRVVVVAQMNKMAGPHLTAGTKFWVVRPRFSLSGLSGLETLVSGAYIEMDPGQGKSTHFFQGLEEPPIVRSDVAGSEFGLTTQKIGSIGPGSPIYYRGIQVGEVIRYTFAGEDKGIDVQIFVREPYNALIYEGTRFWNASGINLSTGAGGFKVEVDSLQAVLSGGISFETPEGTLKGQRSKEGTVFPLHDDREEARDASFTSALHAIVEFSGSVRGLEVGAPVEFRGMKVGKVLNFYIEGDPVTMTFHIPVTIALEVERIHIVGGNQGQFGSGALLPALVERGLRAQLRSGNLITGQMVVALDFFPDAPPASIVQTDTYPILPTVPNDLENITRSVSDTLDRIAALPLDQVVQDVRKVLASVLAITDSPDLRESAKSLNGALGAAQQLMHESGVQVGPLATSLRHASDSADVTLKQADTALASMNAGYGRDSRVRLDLSDMLRQLQEAARSVRMLAGYLEMHPEALMRGKTGGPQ